MTVSDGVSLRPPGRGGVGRADLLACFFRWGPGGLDHAAECMGFARPGKRKRKPAGSKVTAGIGTAPGDGEVTEEKLQPGPGTQPPIIPAVQSQLPFWRAVEYREKDVDETQWDEPEWLKGVTSFAPGEVRADESARKPGKQPLLPWSRLWPFLFAALGDFCPSRTVDMERVVEMAARVEPVYRVPFRKRLTWAGNCQVILDADERLMPFWDDEGDLLRRLRRMRGLGGMEVLVFNHGPGEPCRRWGEELDKERPYRLPEPGTPVLVVSDLGCLDRDKNPAARTAWQRIGKRLKRAGFSPVVLSPCPPRLWDEELHGIWRLACWDRGMRTPRPGGAVSARGGGRRGQETHMGGRIEELLGLLSPAIRIEPALLRAVRLLLPRREADAAVEAAAWKHEHMRASPIAMAFHGDSIEYYRDLFQKHPRMLQERVISCIKEYHGHLSPAVRGEEDLIAAAVLHEPEPGVPVADEKMGNEGTRFIERFVRTQLESAQPGREGRGRWLMRLSERMHREVWKHNDALTAAWVLEKLEQLKQGRLAVPPGMDIQKAAWVWGRKWEPRRWVLRRRGDVFVPDCEGWMSEAGPEGRMDRGSPVAGLTLGSPLLNVNIPDGGREEPYSIPLYEKSKQPIQILVPEEGKISLDTDHERVVLESFTMPEGATEIKRDCFGLSTVFPGRDEERRLYWLNPGKYPVYRWEKSGGTGSAPLVFLVRKTGCWMDREEYLDWIRHGIVRPQWADIIGVDKYGLFADVSIKGVIQRMRWIHPGEFLMGSPEDEPERYDDEVLHKVLLTRGYWLADTACTQELWEAVMGKRKNSSNFKGAQRPVDSVSWDDCMKFYIKINKMKPGLALRFPTEAEWEYACRAGTRTPFHFGDHITPAQVNYDGSNPYADGEKGKSRGETVEVKALPCNDWGLYQMHGNVWEWCSDRDGEYDTELQVDPDGGTTGAIRVLRGGSWILDGGVVRSAYRSWYDPSHRWRLRGLRLSQGQKEQAGKAEPFKE